MPRPTLRLLAPAKVNLALAVDAPEASGLHPICSWMLTVDLCDEIEVTQLEPDRFSRYAILWHDDAKRPSDIDWSIQSDLAVRAHLALEQRAGHRLPLQMKLEKRISVGGGLGGGSADAAAMLHAVNQLFELGLSNDDLAGIGADLGSDVPFLVHGGSAIVEGTGASISRHDAAPELDFVLVLPDIACNTGEIYRLFDEVPNAEGFQPDRVESLVRESDAGRLADLLFNDLAPPAMRAKPQLESEMARISRLAERTAHLTGSGSSLFVVCDDSLHAEALARTIEGQLELPAVAVRTHVGGPCRVTTV